jgi:AcrR family transcriptional regulator
MTPKVKISLRERKKLQLDNHIIESAIDLFEKKGYHNVSIDEIVEFAEISKGTFYNYYLSKDTLLNKIATAAWNSANESILKDFVNQDPIQTILLFLEKFIDEIYSYKNIAKVVAMKCISQEFTVENLDLLKNYIKQAQENNSFRKDYSTDTIFKMIVGTFFMNLFIFDSSATASDCKKEFKTSFQLLLSGISA